MPCTHIHDRLRAHTREHKLNGSKYETRKQKLSTVSKKSIYRVLLYYFIFNLKSRSGTAGVTSNGLLYDVLFLTPDIIRLILSGIVCSFRKRISLNCTCLKCIVNYGRDSLAVFVHGSMVRFFYLLESWLGYTWIQSKYRSVPFFKKSQWLDFLARSDLGTLCWCHNLFTLIDTRWAILSTSHQSHLLRWRFPDNDFRLLWQPRPHLTIPPPLPLSRWSGTHDHPGDGRCASHCAAAARCAQPRASVSQVPSP